MTYGRYGTGIIRIYIQVWAICIGYTEEGETSAISAQVTIGGFQALSDATGKHPLKQLSYPIYLN